jgi:hypothetical protein
VLLCLGMVALMCAPMAIGMIRNGLHRRTPAGLDRPAPAATRAGDAPGRQ